MSTWKKAAKVNQKTHRERHQPASRAHLGILEKKKDYLVRAKDYNAKQKTLKALKIQALNRNPDEFYYHMINSQMKDGKHTEKKKPEDCTPEQKELIENRNIGYIAMKRSMENKKIDRLQAGLHMVDLAQSVKSNHIYFDESKEEDKGRAENVAIGELSLHNINRTVVNKANKLKERQYKMLARRIDRHKQLSIIQEKMEVAKHLRKRKGFKPTLMQPETKSQAPIFKWKYERKR